MVSAREELLQLLIKHSYRKQRVILASGKESDFFIDCKQTVLLGRGHYLVGQLMLDAARELNPNVRAVAGVELGGCPLASAVATLSAATLNSTSKGSVVDAIYVRKQAKDHGSKRLVEGSDGLEPGVSVIVLEDVITTGGSTLRAVETMRAAGLNVAGVVALVDRSEGGKDAIAAAGLAVVSVFNKQDFASGS